MKKFLAVFKKHTTNFNDHKENHRSFFDDRNINKYYKSHVSILSKQIKELEKGGYKICNVTTSNIDILKKKY